MWCFARLSTKICLLGCFSSFTWKYLSLWWDVVFNIYTFLSTCRLCAIYLFRYFLPNSILSWIPAFCIWWKSVIYFNIFYTLLWLFMSHILKAIWKSMHWHLNISINSKALFFPHKIFIEKIKHLHMTIATLVLNYLAPVSLCYN